MQKIYKSLWKSVSTESWDSGQRWNKPDKEKSAKKSLFKTIALGKLGFPSAVGRAT